MHSTSIRNMRMTVAVCALCAVVGCDLPIAVADIGASRLIYRQSANYLDLLLLDDEHNGCLHLDAETSEFVLNGKVVDADTVVFGGRQFWIPGDPTPPDSCFPSAYISDVAELELGDKVTFEVRDDSGSVDATIVGIAAELLALPAASVTRGETLVIAGERDADVQAVVSGVVSTDDGDHDWDVSRVGTELHVEIPADAPIGAATFFANALTRDVDVTCGAENCEVEISSWTTTTGTEFPELSFEIVE